MSKFKVGDLVKWNSEAGHVKGTIQRVYTKPFTVNGYTKHASVENPVYGIKSNISDHVAYHFALALNYV